MEIRVKRGEEQYGPYLQAEARSYLREGRLVADDLGSTDGVTWRPLRELLGYPPGGLAARFGAALLDFLIALVFLVPGLLAMAQRFDVGVTDEAYLLLGAGGLVGIGYQFVKDGFSGRSLGKRAAGLIVVHLPTNRPCSIVRSAVRTLVIFLTNGLLGIGWVIEPLLVIVTSDRRRLGDRAASTQVIGVADYQPSP
jgi:uncharacterized RDD family membrane protein YckC